MPRPAQILRPLPLFALLACGADPAAPPAPEAPAAEEALALRPWPAATVTLLQAGEPPLAPLRLSPPAAGGRELLRYGSTFTLTPAAADGPAAPVVLVEGRQAALELDPPDADGAVGLRATLTNGRRHPQGQAPDPAFAARLEGRRAAWRLSPRCEVLGAALDGAAASGGGGEGADELDTVLEGLVTLCPPLPEPALGVGARWAVDEPGDGGGPRRTEWLLLQRLPDGGAVLTFHTREGGPEAPRELLAEGRVELPAGRATPTRLDLRGHARRVVTGPMGESATVETDWITLVEGLDAPAGSP
jgi:hypothetical protein